MKPRKLGLSILLALILSVRTISLGWAIMMNDSARLLLAYSLHFAVAAYILFMAVFSISLCDVQNHWKITVHLSIMSTTAFLMLGISAMLPTEESFPIILVAFQSSTLALYFLASIIAIRTKRGPKLHFPVESIYSEKIIAHITSLPMDNVCGTTGMHPTGFHTRDTIYVL